MTSSESKEAIWAEEFKVHSYDVDFKKMATLESLCRHFQEAAWAHAEQLGVGYKKLQQENQLWVLARLLVKAERYPTWGEMQTLHTWPRAAKSVFAMRDFEMLDSSATRIVAGASAWLVLDATTRKPQRVDKLVSTIIGFSDRHALAQEPQKLRPFESKPPMEEFTVRYSDIDVNGHVNNSRYIGWIMDAHPVEFHRAHEVSLFEVNYLAETIGGDAISIFSQELAPGEYWYSITNPTTGAVVCRARIIWTPITQK